MERAGDQTVSALGRLDAAFNNAGVKPSAVEVAAAGGEEFDSVTSLVSASGAA
jgi:NAD(P)-dependent dehydrogenase (short-subunit alcohol dehydrogenase family)